jgi:hypothetical protein
MPAWFGIVVGPLVQWSAGLVIYYLVRKNVYSPTVGDQIVAMAVASLPSAIWQAVLLIRARILLYTAAAMHPASVQEVKAQVKAGNAPPLSVPTDRVPYLEGQKPVRYSTDPPGSVYTPKRNGEDR